MEYIIQDKKLIWDFDNGESNAAKLKDNNLFLEGIWNMEDTVGYADACVAVRILSDDTFYFITFRGLGFTMRLVGNTVECIKTQITKWRKLPNHRGFLTTAVVNDFIQEYSLLRIKPNVDCHRELLRRKHMQKFPKKKENKPVYYATKGAVAMMTKALANEWARKVSQ